MSAQFAGAPVPIRVISMGGNEGFGAAANRGLREAAHPLVWLLNNDVSVEPDAIELLAGHFEEDDRTLLAVHSRMFDPALGRDAGTGKTGGFSRGFLRVHRSYLPQPGAAGPFWSMFATGGSSMFQRDLFLGLGGFDPIFAPFYFEDVELSYRAWKRGLSVRYAPQSVVRHEFSSTIGPLARRRVERISQRNRLLFHWIHLHDPAFWRAHVLWLAILVLTGPFTLKLGFLGGFADALRGARGIQERRRRERSEARRSDREVLDIFREQAASGRVRVYDDAREVEEK